MSEEAFEPAALVLGPRIGAKSGDVRVDALVGAALAALDAATRSWSASNGELNLIALIDTAFEAIEGPAPNLR